MSLNCNEIDLILQELSLEGAFIQDIIQPGYDTLALYTYKEGSAKTVLICTSQNSVRLNSTARKITKNEKPLRFMEFLRSRIKGCRISTCGQIGLERVIKMTLTQKKNTDGANTEEKKSEDTDNAEINSSFEIFNLYIRLWNNAANVILCDEQDLVLDSMFRRPERYEVKGEVFIPPAVIEEKYNESEKFPVREWNTSSENLSETPAFKSFNEYIDWWYSEKSSSLSRAALLEKNEKWYLSNLSKRESALKNLEDKLESFSQAEKFKHYGDLLLAVYTPVEKGTKSIECEDFETGNKISIIINPQKTLQENAAEYYRQYKKAVNGKEELERDIQIAKAQINNLTAEYEKIKNEKNPVKIEQLLRKNTTPAQQKKKTHPGLDYTVNGWYILVGRNANENDELLRHHVRGEDLWLHVRDYSGGYVFIKARKGKTVPLDILLDAANLAVYYSKARNAGTTDLYYTHVKYLRRAKNGPKGLVLPTQEKNLCIKPDKARLAKLDSLQKEAEF
ncbi:MAG: NFACT family protein [Treponema sp.]|nr:NFACT family protein [Treponema sp.]